jgi:plasmid stabilization system protein ParE
MGLKILWLDSARMQLEDIFSYYRDNASLLIAQKLKNQIYNRTCQLETFPESGPREPLLSSRKFEYRYLVEGNFKIIYWVDKQTIKIAAIFDCRQNREKMKV